MLNAMKKIYQRLAKSAPKVSNEVFTIRPYRLNGLWVVTDESKGLHEDTFEFGVPEVFEEAMQRSGVNPGDSFTLKFAAVPVGDKAISLVWFDEDFCGHYYRSETGKECWFSPAIFRYLGDAPKRLWLEAVS